MSSQNPEAVFSVPRPEAFDPSPIRRVPPKMQAATIDDLAREARDLAAELQRIDEQLSRDLQAVDISRLKADVAQAEQKAIREKAAERGSRIVRRLTEIVDTVAEQPQHFTPQAVKARATFDADPLKDATIGSYWLGRLAAADLGELEEVARGAAGASNLALAYAVSREVLRRSLDAGARDSILRLVQATALPPAESGAIDRLMVIRTSAELALASHVQATTGRDLSNQRLAAAVAAGLGSRRVA
jgi:hypothetical protein